jgi:hypothetical protein
MSLFHARKKNIFFSKDALIIKTNAQLAGLIFDKIPVFFSKISKEKYFLSIKFYPIYQSVTICSSF